MEARGKQAASFFSSIKVEALSVMAIFTAGMGLKSFVQDTLSSSAKLQNLAGNLQQSSSEVMAWEKSFERAGASASDATSLFTSAANEIGKLKTGQGMGEALKGIAMAGGNVNEALKGPREMVLEESRVLAKLNAINPALARARAMQMGLSDAQFDSLKKVIVDWLTVTKDALKLIFALFTGNASDIRKAWGALVGDLGKYFTDWVGLIKNLGPAILSAFKGAFAAAFDWVKSRAKTIWNAITGKGDTDEPSAADSAASAVAQVKQAVSSAGKGIADGAFGALISKGEGGYNSVNRGAKGGYKAGTEDLGNMTVAEVMAAQRSGKFNAAGKYQLIGSTLSDAVKTLGLKGDEKFDKGTQDKIFEQYLVNNKRKAIGDYINGKSDNIGAAIKSASMEWASVSDPSTGQSHYAGVGNNKASISVAQMTEALQNARMAATGNRGSSSSSEVNIAQVTIQTQATDANGMARDAQAAFSKHPLLAAQANTGLS